MNPPRVQVKTIVPAGEASSVAAGGKVRLGCGRTDGWGRTGVAGILTAWLGTGMAGKDGPLAESNRMVAVSRATITRKATTTEARSRQVQAGE